jgi:hypothetical protein
MNTNSIDDKQSMIVVNHYSLIKRGSRGSLRKGILVDIVKELENYLRSCAKNILSCVQNTMCH